MMQTKNFCDKLKQARNDAGYTQSEVCDVIHINRATLSNYETGRLEPNLDTLAKLADFYCVSVDWLLGTKGGK